MNQPDFDEVVNAALGASRDVLTIKGKEYSTDSDRLANFKMAAGSLGTNPVDALVSFAAKHFVSISMMAKTPARYDMKTWIEKTTDLRNYTILLEALLTDIGLPMSPAEKERIPCRHEALPALFTFCPGCGERVK